MSHWVEPDGIWLMLVPITFGLCLLGLTVVARRRLVVGIAPKSILIGYFAILSFVGYVLLPVSLSGVRFEGVAKSIIWSGMHRAALLNSLGLVMMYGGVLYSQHRNLKAAPRFNPWERRILSISAKRVLVVALACMVAGSAAIFITFRATGVIPLLANNPLVAKYFQGTVRYVKTRPIYNLGLNWLPVAVTLGLSLGVGFFRPSKFQRCLGIGVALFALGMLVLTMKRGPMLYPFLWVAGGLLFTGRIRLRSFIGGVISLLAIGIFLWTLRRGSFEISSFIYPVSTNFGIEQRDLGRVFVRLLSGYDFEWAFGKTYLASLISLIPSSISEFKSTYIIGRFTMVVLGINPEISGAPRIWFTGEAFFNLGVGGVIIVGFLYGLSIGWLDDYYWRVRVVVKEWDARMLWIFYLTTSWMAFGTSGSAIVQFFIVRTLPLLVLLLPRVRLLRRQRILVTERV